MEKMHSAGVYERRTVTPLSTKELLGLSVDKRNEIMQDSAEYLLNVFTDSGAIVYEKVSDMYKALGHVQLVARREDPQKLIDSVEDNETITIDFPQGERYSNAVMWNPQQGVRGLENTYLEGYSHFNGSVTVYGFLPKEHLDIETLPDASQRFAGLDREYVRSIKGQVHASDIVFISTRIPITAFPKDKLTDAEKDLYEEHKERGAKSPLFIHRGFLFANHLPKQ